MEPLSCRRVCLLFILWTDESVDQSLNKCDKFLKAHLVLNLVGSISVKIITISLLLTALLQK